MGLYSRTGAAGAGGTRLARGPLARSGRWTFATTGASASHSSDPNRTRYTVTSSPTGTDLLIDGGVISTPHVGRWNLTLR
jgi:hypothetical protein